MLPWAWWKLSYRWLFSNSGRRSQIKQGLFPTSLRTALIGMAFGVGTMAVTLALFSGFRQVLALAMTQALGDVSHYTRWLKRSDLETYQNIIQKTDLEELQFFWTSQALLVGPQGGRGVMIEGRIHSANTTSQKSPAASALPQIDLGRPLAEALGVNVGSKVRLLLPGILRGSVDAEVRNLIAFGMHDIDSRWAVIDDATLRPVLEARDPESFANRPGEAHGLRVHLKGPLVERATGTPAQRWKSWYTSQLQTNGLARSGDLIRTWEEMQRNLLGSMGMDRTILIVVMGLLVCVATLNVAATLVVLFLERDHELAALRALGMTRGALMQWICIQGLMVGLVGSGLGLLGARATGWLISRSSLAKLPPDIYHIDRLPWNWSLPEQAGVFAFGTLAAVLASGLIGLRLARSSFLETLGQRR